MKNFKTKSRFILCEQCGNEFNPAGKVYNENDGKRIAKCPYCKFKNPYRAKTERGRLS